jgi:hypothetical protein
MALNFGQQSRVHVVPRGLTALVRHVEGKPRLEQVVDDIREKA